MARGRITSGWRQRRVRNGETVTAKLGREFDRLNGQSERRERPNAKVSLPFGQHRGKPLCTVPRSYLRWFLREVEGYKKLKAKIAKHLERPKRRRRKDSTTVSTNATAAFRADTGTESPF